ncbi:lysozyme-like domain-containing protein [Dichotomocladium elegans]|nr:lysozyme-like domain-containing protein [Dichotomocladium elegans]
MLLRMALTLLVTVTLKISATVEVIQGQCAARNKWVGGYIGFTTATNDAYVVVNHYLKARPTSPLRNSLKELKRLTTLDFGDQRRAYTGALEKTGYVKAWKEAACTDAQFIQTQLDVGHAMYLKPALKYAASVGVHSNLGKAIFYDTIVQHGWQYVEPLINLPRILYLTGPRRKDESENAYLDRFLSTRRELMCCSASNVWRESVTRVVELQTLVSNWDRHKDLKNTIRLEHFGLDINGTEDISYDMENCHKKPSKLGAKPRDLPTPDTCPNPLMV